MKITVEFDSLEEFELFHNAGKPHEDIGEATTDPVYVPTMPPAPAMAAKTDTPVPTVVTPIPTAAPTTTTEIPVPAPASAPTPADASTPLPTAPAPEYSADDLARAAISVMDQGRMADLQQLLQKFGVSALPQLQPEQRSAFATGLRELGARI